MNIARSSPTLAGEFDAFLFAPVGEEANGMPLSVLSALTRLDIDPWADAARLSRLSKDAAITALGQSLALLPLGKWQPADTTAIATRLIELLQKPNDAPAKAMPAFAKPTNWQRPTTLVLTVVSVALAGYLIFGVTRVEYHAADRVYTESDRAPPR